MTIRKSTNKLNFTFNTAQKKKVRYALSNTFGLVDIIRRSFSKPTNNNFIFVTNLSQEKSESDLKLVLFNKEARYRPKNLDLFHKALTHKSYSNLRDDVQSNERLEYLGDTVIDLIVAHFLFEKFPDRDEGYLTKLKSKIVNETCSLKSVQS